jgi:hypothetical protein
MERIRTLEGQTAPCNHKARHGADAANRVAIGGTGSCGRANDPQHRGIDVHGNSVPATPEYVLKPQVPSRNNSESNKSILRLGFEQQPLFHEVATVLRKNVVGWLVPARCPAGREN